MLVGDFKTLADELRKELQFLAQHLFRADWQHHQFTISRRLDPFPAGTTMMVLDFAENFACQYQDEVQVAHWHHERATIHPIVTYYRQIYPLLSEAKIVPLQKYYYF